MVGGVEVLAVADYAVEHLAIRCSSLKPVIYRGQADAVGITLFVLELYRAPFAAVEISCICVVGEINVVPDFDIKARIALLVPDIAGTVVYVIVAYG